MLKAILLLGIATGVLGVPTSSHPEHNTHHELNVKISVANGLLKSPTDGRLVLMFAPNDTDPLEDTDVTSSPNYIFGKNVFDVSTKKAIDLSGGSNFSTETGVYGWPNVSLNDVPSGNYSVQAFLTRYEKVRRSDGSVVNVRFPCGDGAPNVNGFGSLTTDVAEYEVLGGQQTLTLVFNNLTAIEPLNGKEIGGCNQGNYEDTELLKYVKIRSKKLSAFWGRDIHRHALPGNLLTRPHWPADSGAFDYPSDTKFADAWNSGTIPATNTTAARPAPKMILVTFRHEAPYYDDSYAVNTANLGPYGDAINDELISHIEKLFHTIRAPYARVQEGGSTGGWESIANVIYRPDLFGVCFSSYPDSLDFHRHQDIELYTSANAYQRTDGSFVPSIRTHRNGTEVILASVAQENHWELTFGTASRSFNQWDIWNAIFGVQGYNNYPLEPWDKVTGEIYPEAVELWKPFDLSNYITSNWEGSRNLGAALAGRIYIYVGTWDDYYLNEGVQEFAKRTDAVGGAGWANVTILPEKSHGGNYQDRKIWDYLELVDGWIKDHAPDGTSPLSLSAVAPSTRGNQWKEVIQRGGRQAAVARQALPAIKAKAVHKGAEVQASVGRWDPGVTLEAMWAINGKPSGKPFAVKQGATVKYAPGKKGKLQLLVTGSKRNYATETRHSGEVLVY
ncbi:hypothetical protein BU23DRAFT_595529 [Bimuria novae-zelandiae CBS 107.79]|uniref:Alpha/beta-hydrolase n=1 Tax=Bimuria novae-zelandiae CBS 107.79 TaxID=1447943 RepID=A0A6A5VW33_9PLEO|nr:hypothetical protein BU23DRAFT_595529 [Bimuria novae-zelandiae CBS 107.79]